MAGGASVYLSSLVKEARGAAAIHRNPFTSCLLSPLDTNNLFLPSFSPVVLIHCLNQPIYLRSLINNS